MKNIFDNFTGLYGLSKTLRFELKPIAQTKEYIGKGRVLESDKKKADDYKDVKKIIDNYHKFFIDDVLKNASFDWTSLEKSICEYGKDKRDDSKLVKEQDKLRKEIADFFSKDKRFKYLTASTPSDLFNKDKDFIDWFTQNLEKDINREALETFKRFSSYFKGFQENRKNVYSAEAIPTAVPYRLVNDNFPKFLQNISLFKIIQEKCPQVISDVENELASYLGKEKLADIFTVQSFNKYLGQGGKENQRGIDFYNQILGGIAEKEGGVNLRGINQFLNLYWQQHPDFAKENKRIKMIPLFKQILSDRSSLSFKIETIDTDEELKSAIREYADKLESKSNDEKKSVLDICCDLFASITEQNLQEIYVNRKDINNISRILTGDWSWLQFRMNAYADEVFTRKDEKKRWQKSVVGDEGENKSKGVFSLAELNRVLEYTSGNVAETDIRITDYFEHRKRFYYEKESGLFKQGEELVALSIKESCEDIFAKRKVMDKVFADVSENNSLRNNPEGVAKIKEYLDNVQDLLHRIKPLKVNGLGEPSFYAVFDSLYNALSEVISLYNKTRNYITKKVASPEKYKLNFDNPILVDGWDLNNERAYASVLLRKDGMYYLGVMNPKDKPKFAENYDCGNEACYEKMVYKFFKDVTTMIPKCSTQLKEVKNHFEKSDNDYILDNEKFMKPLIVSKKIYELNNVLYDGKKKFQIDYLRNSGDSKGYDEAVREWISFCMRFVKSYESTSCYDFASLGDCSQFKQIDKFYSAINLLLYKIKFINIPESEINKMVAEGKLYLFQIYNKDFAPGVSGMPNMHTLYWKNLFSEENLKNVCLKLNGEAELFYRPAGIKEPVVHAKGSYLVNRITEDGEPIPEKIHDEIYRNANGKLSALSKEAADYKASHKVVIKEAKHDIIKDRHYTEPKFLFHVPLTINFKASGNSYINENVRRFLKNNPDVNIIGLDRGERHLIYLSLINQKGEIIKQFTFNEVERNKNGQTIKVNYHEKLDQREKERDSARKSWQTIGKIAELKEGYLSAVIHQLTKLMVEYNAIVVMEDLNFGFKRGRFHVEKQVYQKFEHMLIDKLNYLVFKDRGLNEPGGVLNGYQLAGKFVSFNELYQYKQSGMLFYVPARYTSKIDPKTGFVSMLNFKDLTNVHKERDFFSKFDDIHFDDATGSFVFTFDYKNFDGKAKEEIQHTKWSVYSKDKRIVYCSKTKSYDILLTEKLKALFENVGLEYASGNNLIDSIMAIGAELKDGAKPSKEIADFWDGLLYNFKLILQMRNSNAKTGEDYIISPVMADDGTFFDSREEFKKGEGSKLPVDADANGAYHIALKGLSLLKRFDVASEAELKKFDMKISNADWFKFAQEKSYAK